MEYNYIMQFSFFLCEILSNVLSFFFARVSLVQ